MFFLIKSYTTAEWSLFTRCIER